MLKLNFDNISADIVGEANGISAADWANHADAFAVAHEKVVGWRASGDAVFFDMPSHAEMVGQFEKVAKDVRDNFTDVIVLGIGGSALGLSCLSRATLKPFYNVLDKQARGGTPRLFVCDNIDPETFGTLLSSLDPKTTFVNVISKSGGTTETMSQFALAKSWLEKALGEKWKDNVAATTDPSSGKLRAYVSEHGLRAFEVPPKLGGRYSVLSAVGLFPAACVGIDIAEALKGAAAMAKKCEVADAQENPGYRVGAVQFLVSSLKKKNVTVMMPYADRLALMGDWFAQLWAESLGKEGKGQTVVKSLGATDQHSQIQLFMEGPHDKMLTFVGVEKFGDDGPSLDEPFPSFEYLKGAKLGTILNAELKATSTALAKQGHPNMTVTVDQANAYAMGELFMLYEVACAYCGALMGVNPFNQPGVELGKVLTKEILGG